MSTDLLNELTVVVVDDEKSIREGCRQTLHEGGYNAQVAKDGIEGLQMIEELKPCAVLVDLKMPGMSGMDLLKRIRGIDLETVAIVITGYGAIDSAVEAMKLGARDYICKPFDDRQLLAAIESELETGGEEKDGRHEAATEIEGSVNREVIIEVLERAAREHQFITRLTEEGSKALEAYDLSSEAKAALISGDIQWVESRVGQLNDRQRTWLLCRLEQERW